MTFIIWKGMLRRKLKRCLIQVTSPLQRWRNQCPGIRWFVQHHEDIKPNSREPKCWHRACLFHSSWLESGTHIEQALGKRHPHFPPTLHMCPQPPFTWFKTPRVKNGSQALPLFHPGEWEPLPPLERGKEFLFSLWDRQALCWNFISLKPSSENGGEKDWHCWG